MSIGVFMPNIIAGSEEQVVLPAGKLPFDRMDLFFTADQWASPATKRIIVRQGTEVWHGDFGYVLAITGAGSEQAGSFNGRLILENNGIMSGKGGEANGGVGGDVINANFSGRNGQKLEIINNGIIRAGGGGGGQGGTGGGGSVTSQIREPATGDYFELYQYHWAVAQGKTQVVWQGVDLPAQPSDVTQFTYGGFTYYRGNLRSSNTYGVYRTGTTTVNTNGGAGGAGGVGQGFNQSAGSGSQGAVGGQNAGRGGTGGMGGLFGSQGSTGSKGQDGNRTAGSNGSAGGLAGYYVDGNINVEWLVTGMREGRSR